MSQKEPDRTPARQAIEEAVRREFGKEGAANLAFHLMDWTSEAAFILAVAMFPKKFTKKEIETGIGMLLIHVPNHVAAASKIAGVQCKDIWKEKPAENKNKRRWPTNRRTVRRETLRP